jgi:hypothetical protein
MKAMIVIAMLASCGRGAEDVPDRWAEVERLARPTVPAADPALLQQAIDGVEGDDVPEAALEAAIEWSKAGGGLPWRESREPGAHHLTAFRIGTELITRRGTPDAIGAASYLGHRLRAEGVSLLDVVMGVTLADRVREHRKAERPTADEVRLAPTDAEVRRAIAADGVTMMKLVPASSKEEDRVVIPSVRAHFQRLVLDAPADRAGLIKQLEAETARAQKSMVGEIIVSPRLPTMVRKCFEEIDSYRAWLAGP